ncbi:hypothetical protein EI94DRAFT_33070 [Lactarius quietus]|nr:hypothetical protein EI94DRAFT_33070 [Lactarius quietus]
MTRPIRPLPLPPAPHPPLAQRSSLDTADPSSSGSSTPALSDECQPPLEEHALRHTVSLPIIPSTTSVKFAPLPEIGPRKRRSNYPLGIAARSQMLQQRRENAGMQGVYRPAPLWSDLDAPEEVEEEDPLEALGRLIADKSKSLWRRVAAKGNSSDKHAAPGDVNEDTTQSLSREELPSPSDPPTPNLTLEPSDNNGDDTVENSLRKDSS